MSAFDMDPANLELYNQYFSFSPAELSPETESDRSFGSEPSFDDRNPDPFKTGLQAQVANFETPPETHEKAVANMSGGFTPHQSFNRFSASFSLIHDTIIEEIEPSATSPNASDGSLSCGPSPPQLPPKPRVLHQKTSSSPEIEVSKKSSRIWVKSASAREIKEQTEKVEKSEVLPPPPSKSPAVFGNSLTVSDCFNTEPAAVSPSPGPILPNDSGLHTSSFDECATPQVVKRRRDHVRHPRDPESLQKKRERRKTTAVTKSDLNLRRVRSSSSSSPDENESCSQRPKFRDFRDGDIEIISSSAEQTFERPVLRPLVCQPLVVGSGFEQVLAERPPLPLHFCGV